MATSAIRPKFAVVNIVCPVAVSAFTFGCLHFLERSSMAVITRDVDVGSVKCEVRLHVVVECPSIPVNRVVTAVALTVEVATVRVVFLVTGNALGICLAKYL